LGFDTSKFPGREVYDMCLLETSERALHFGDRSLSTLSRAGGRIVRDGSQELVACQGAQSALAGFVGKF